MCNDSPIKILILIPNVQQGGKLEPLKAKGTKTEGRYWARNKSSDLIAYKLVILITRICSLSQNNIL